MTSKKHDEDAPTQDDYLSHARPGEGKAAAPKKGTAAQPAQQTIAVQPGPGGSVVLTPQAAPVVEEPAPGPRPGAESVPDHHGGPASQPPYPPGKPAKLSKSAQEAEDLGPSPSKKWVVGPRPGVKLVVPNPVMTVEGETWQEAYANYCKGNAQNEAVADLKFEHAGD